MNPRQTDSRLKRSSAQNKFGFIIYKQYFLHFILSASLYQFLFYELGQNKRIEFDKTENTLAFTIDI